MDMASTNPPTAVQTAFQLPLCGLFADLEEGMGSVRLVDDFHARPALTQLAIIRDWERDLSTAKLRALVQLYAETADTSESTSAPEKLKAFEVVCTSLGIACPPSFPLALQRF